MKTYLTHVQQLLRLKKTASIDSCTLLRALKSRTNLSSIKTQGTQIQQLAINLGFQSVVFLQTALLATQSQSGQLDNAHKLFDEMPQRNLVTWTALISAYVNNQRPNKALDIFWQMQMEYVEPDVITLTVALSACADLSALNADEWIHTYIRKQGLGEDVILTNALVNMYCKCGSITVAHQLFQTAKQRDVTTWTSISMGYALHGRALEALQLFEEMKCIGFRPNSVTFLGMLTACRHAGVIAEGKRQWEKMKIFYPDLKRNVAHYGCTVDLLCRAGQLEEAYRFMETMPVQPNAVIWRTLLGACSLKGDFRIGDIARKRLLELEPESVGDGVVMSNVYANAGKWEEKEQVRRKETRSPGCSLIEVGSRIHEYVAGDRIWVKMTDLASS